MPGSRPIGVVSDKPTRLSRRGVLTAALGVAALSAAPRAALASPAVMTETPWRVAREMRSVSFVHAATGERFSAVYFEDGRYLDDALAWADWVLRDVNTDQAMVMDNRLIDLIARVKAEIGGREIVVTSGYRTPETNARLRRRNRRAARNSLHILGQAVDFYSPGVSARRLARVAAGERMGGVGSYRGARFVHMDTGPIRSWRG